MFRAADDGQYGPRSGLFRVERELLMPQLLLRHIARRAVQVAIVAGGILIVLLVFSRQAHAAISAPAPSSVPAPASAPAPAPTASAVPTSAPAPAPSSAPAPAPAPSSAPAPASAPAP